ncbi:hypothetical protein G9A89_001793 [Geosiphon pyriformis]|nr:hypothetical protein G9A89_001793 [Geosiphon pyriformis]
MSQPDVREISPLIQYRHSYPTYRTLLDDDDAIMAKCKRGSEPFDYISYFNDQTAEVSSRERIILFIGLCLALYLTAIDQTIVAIALPKVSTAFHSLSHLSWVSTAYLLSSTAAQPIFGKLSDIFGRKLTFLLAIDTYLLGSLLSGASQTMIVLIASRGISGIGSGGILSLSNIILSDIIPMRERAKFQGIIGGKFAITSVIGPLICGVLTDHVGWRWAFWLNIPIGFVSTWITVNFLNLPHVYGSLQEKLMRIDFRGTFVFVLAIFSILLPLNWGGMKYEWNSPLIISLFSFAALCILIFIFIESRIAFEPIIAIRIFKIWNPVIIFICNFLIGITFFGIAFYWPLFFQAIRSEKKMDTAFRIVPLTVGLVSFSVCSGFATTITGHYRPFLTFGYSMVTIGALLLSTIKETSNDALAFTFILTAGAGFGSSIQTALLAAQTSVAFKDIAVVTSLTTFFRSIGGIFGVAICSSAFNHFLAQHLVGLLPPGIELGKVMNSIAYVKTLPLDIQQPIIHAYVQALNFVFLLIAPAAALAAFLSLFLKHVPLRTTLGPRADET